LFAVSITTAPSGPHSRFPRFWGTIPARAVRSRCFGIGTAGRGVWRPVRIPRRGTSWMTFYLPESHLRRATCGS